MNKKNISNISLAAILSLIVFCCLTYISNENPKDAIPVMHRVILSAVLSGLYCALKDNEYDHKG